MKQTLAGIAVLLLLVRPAVACLNDREMVSSEQEFRSAYLRGPVESAADAVPLWVIEIFGGAGLVFGSVYLLLKRLPERPSHPAELSVSERISVDHS